MTDLMDIQMQVDAPRPETRPNWVASRVSKTSDSLDRAFEEGLTGHVITARDGRQAGPAGGRQRGRGVRLVLLPRSGDAPRSDRGGDRGAAPLRAPLLHVAQPGTAALPRRAGGAPLRHVRRRAGGRLHLGQQRPSGLAAAARRRRPAQLSRGRRRRRVPRREDGARLHPGDPRRARADRADAALRHDRSRSAARSGPRGRGHRSDADRAGRRGRLDGRPDRRGFDAGRPSSRSVATCTWTTPTGSRSTARSAPGTRSKRSEGRSLPMSSSPARCRRPSAAQAVSRSCRARKTCGFCESSQTPWCLGTRSCFPCWRRTSPPPGCTSTAKWPSCNGGSGATPPSSTG